jgi:hypothetical protein
VGLWAAAFCHTEMAGELAVLEAAASSATGFVLRRSPAETSRLDVIGDLVAKFWRLDELCSWLERSGVRICDLLLGPPLSLAQWADHLDEATGWLRVELVAQREVDTKLEELQSSATRVWDFVLGNVDESSSLAASLSVVVELLEGCIDASTANGVHWGTRSALVVTLSHFPELEIKLEQLRSTCNADLTDD